MPALRKNWFLLIKLSVIVFLFSGCGSGELPTAVEQPQELFAVSVKQPPVLDGRANDAVWQQAPRYRVFIDNNSGVNAPASGFLMEFKAAWWKETEIDTAQNDASEVIYVGFLATWPDADKSLSRQVWSYDPATAKWSQSQQGSDWMMMYWLSSGKDRDIWYWDAALTNPMGYFQDMTLEGFQSGQTVTPYFARVDGLNFLNDTPTNRNTWDLNYNDNKTPRDSTDDRPKFAWKNDAEVTPPALPPVYSEASENRQFLIDYESAVLASSPYATPNKAVSLPSFVLQEPLGGSADIRSFGRYENGYWTVEFMRKGTGTETSDIPFDPEERFFSQVFVVTVGNNALSPFESTTTGFRLNNPVQLTFQFILED